MGRRSTALFVAALVIMGTLTGAGWNLTSAPAQQNTASASPRSSDRPPTTSQASQRSPGRARTTPPPNAQPEPLPEGLSPGTKNLLSDYRAGQLDHKQFAQHADIKIGLKVPSDSGLPERYRDQQITDEERNV